MKKILLIILLIFCSSSSFAKNSSSTTGFNITDIAPGSTLEILGFQIGDKILSYDDKIVNSPAEAMNLYNKLKEGTVKQVTIERNGKKQILNAKTK
jgi:general secretion pathway protein C